MDEAAAAAGRFGYPVVAKPRGVAASIGVVRVSGPGQLAGAFALVDRVVRAGQPDFSDGVLIKNSSTARRSARRGALGGATTRHSAWPA